MIWKFNLIILDPNFAKFDKKGGSQKWKEKIFLCRLLKCFTDSFDKRRMLVIILNNSCIIMQTQVHNMIVIKYLSRQCGLLCGLWSLGASVLFLNDGISTGGAIFDVLPPRSGTLHKHTQKKTSIECYWCQWYNYIVLLKSCQAEFLKVMKFTLNHSIKCRVNYLLTRCFDSKS